MSLQPRHESTVYNLAWRPVFLNPKSSLNMSAPPDGTYYIMNDATRTSLHSEEEKITAKPYTNNANFHVRAVLFLMFEWSYR